MSDLLHCVASVLHNKPPQFSSPQLQTPDTGIERLDGLNASVEMLPHLGSLSLSGHSDSKYYWKRDGDLGLLRTGLLGSSVLRNGSGSAELSRSQSGEE